MQLLRWVISRLKGRSHQIAARLRPIHEFKAVFGRERARADRRETNFALIVVRTDDFTTEQVQAFANAALQRIRCTDEAGWCEQHKLAFLLPDTDATGAAKVASDLEELLVRNSIPPRSQTLVYPRDWYPEVIGSRSEQEETRHDRRGGGGGVLEPVSNHGSRENGTSRNGTRTPPGRTNRATGSHESANFSRVEPPAAVRLNGLPPWKRGADIVLSLLALVVFAPVMLVAAILVRTTSKGPIIFRQQRCSVGGRTFPIYKFRTMHVDAEARKHELLALNELSGPVFKIAKDPRRTAVGKVLRKTSIDELPQLWNVLMGHMSMVGPRPPLPSEVGEYKAWQRHRLDVVSGITGIWQVRGRNRIGFEDWMRLDIEYVRRRSFWLDLTILLKTIPAVISCRGSR